MQSSTPSDMAAFVATSPARRRRVGHLAEAHGWRCHYCLTPLAWSSVTEDHVWPSSRYGRSEVCNLVLACATCNGRLGDSVGKCGCRWCVRATLLGRGRERLLLGTDPCSTCGEIGCPAARLRAAGLTVRHRGPDKLKAPRWEEREAFTDASSAETGDRRGCYDECA